jgi:hypothetical protein
MLWSYRKTFATKGKVTGGDLVATVAYADFDFRFDFLLAASSNTGVLYFTRGGLGQKLTGHEYQIIDDVHNPDGLKGWPDQADRLPLRRLAADGRGICPHGGARERGVLESQAASSSKAGTWSTG